MKNEDRVGLSDNYGLKKIAHYLPKLTLFALQRFPSARWALVLAVVGVVLEYATLTTMLPLSGTSSIGIGVQVSKAWRSIVKTLGLPDSPRTWLWLFLLLLGLRVLLGFAQVSLDSYVGKRIMAFLCGGAFERVVVQEPLALIYQRSVGHYLAMAGDEALRVGQIFFNLVQMLSALLAALIGLVVLYLFSPLAFQLTVLFLLLAAISLLAMLGRVFRTSGELADLSRQIATMFVEAINGIRSIRSMAGEEFVASRFVNFIRGYTRTLFFLDVFNHVSRVLPALFLVFIGLVVLFPRAEFFGTVSTAFFFAVTAMLVRVLGFLGTAVSSGGNLVKDIRVAFDLSEILDTAARPIPKHFERFTATVRDIAFRNLVCGYKNNPSVLSGISGNLAAGRCYVLAGRSGSGKSTLADVLLGFLAPQEGELRVNGISYEQLDMNSLRRRVVLVEQQTRIFSGTVRENIAFGLTPTAAEVKLAVDAAGLHEFINTLPDGLETRLDYQGANLSDGQRQRIGLARAIVRQPDVLILDEATNALDSQTRDTVLKHLREIFRDRTLFFITHDSYIINAVDEIWQIRKGKLVIETRGVMA